VSAEGWRGGKFMRATNNNKSLPCNPALRTRAKELRKAGILHEVLVWNRIKSDKLNGFDFDRQKIISSYIVDFFWAEKNAVIEIDGSSHNDKAEYDEARDDFLKSLNLTVIHINAADVLSNMDGVIAFLKNRPSTGGEFIMTKYMVAAENFEVLLSRHVKHRTTVKRQLLYSLQHRRMTILR
jgi:very-short-patch-repair endonuclease